MHTVIGGHQMAAGDHHHHHGAEELITVELIMELIIDDDFDLNANAWMHKRGRWDNLHRQLQRWKSKNICRLGTKAWDFATIRLRTNNLFL